MSRIKSLCVMVGLLPLLVVAPRPTLAADPIKIGTNMALTGAFASSGKACLLAMQMWADDVNGRGGLLDRKVEILSYDDQGTPSTVPGIVSKLLNVDKVDFVVPGYGTGQIIPVIPTAMQRNILLVSMPGMDPNSKFHYNRFFHSAPHGPNPTMNTAAGFFEVAKQQTPRPETVAIVSVDSELGKTMSGSARALAKEAGFKIVYDQSYPPSTVDVAPILRTIQATNPDMVFITSLPVDTAALVRAISELKFQPKMIGGVMVGLQYASLRTQLGPLLNGIINLEFYAPEPTMDFPGIRTFLEKYQQRAAAEGIDQLGYYLPPFCYSGMQFLEQAINNVKSLDNAKLADYLHNNEINTIVGKVRFTPDGERAETGALTVQYRNIVGNDLEQFKKSGKAIIIAPARLKSGDLVYPYKNPSMN